VQGSTPKKQSEVSGHSSGAGEREENSYSFPPCSTVATAPSIKAAAEQSGSPKPEERKKKKELFQLLSSSFLGAGKTISNCALHVVKETLKKSGTSSRWRGGILFTRQRVGGFLSFSLSCLFPLFFTFLSALF
jgi:hypothetical protein